MSCSPMTLPVVESRHGHGAWAGKNRPGTRARRTARRRDARCRRTKESSTAGRRVGGVAFTSDGVDEPDPSLARVVEPAIGHLLSVRGEVGVRVHLGVADLGRLLQIRVLHRPVPGAQHRIAAAFVDQVTVRAEADAPRSGGVPPFQRPAGGGVPDDELTVVGVRPHQRAVGGELDVADLGSVSTQRVDRRPGGGTHQGRFTTRFTTEVRECQQGPLGVHVERPPDRDVRAPPDPVARRHVVRRQRPARVEDPTVRAERHELGLGSSRHPDGGRGRGAEVPDHRVARGLVGTLSPEDRLHGGGQVATVGAEPDIHPPHRLAAGDVRASSSAAWCPGPAGAPARWSAVPPG